MRTDHPLRRRVEAGLASLDARGLRRTLRPPHGVDLSSNDYLGLARHPLLIQRLADAAAREGCGSTGSRLLRGERASFEAIERRFAQFKGSERSLFFGSGYLANLAVLTTLPEAGDIVLSDERNHASLIDGMRLSRARTIIFPHNDAHAVRRLLDDSPSSGIRFIAAESLFSMDGDFAPLEEYAEICRETGACLIVDEAHAVGVFGEHGSGLLEGAEAAEESFPAPCLSINTAGKALGVAGAFVAGPAWAIDFLIQKARPFIFSTAPPPAVADALEASLDLVRDEPERRERVLALAAHLRSRLSAMGLMGGDMLPGRSQIVPIMIGENQRATAVADALQASGFDARAIRPPSVPEGTARLRVSLNAGLTTAVLDRFVDALALALQETSLCSTASS